MSTQQANEVNGLAYLLPGFIIPSVLLWGATATADRGGTPFIILGLLFLVSVFLYYFQAAVIVGVLLAVDTYQAGGMDFMLSMLIPYVVVVFFIAGLGFLLDDVMQFGSNVVNNAKTPATRDVHHYHHLEGEATSDRKVAVHGTTSPPVTPPAVRDPDWHAHRSTHNGQVYWHSHPDVPGYPTHYHRDDGAAVGGYPNWQYQVTQEHQIEVTDIRREDDGPRDR